VASIPFSNCRVFNSTVLNTVGQAGRPLSGGAKQAIARRRPMHFFFGRSDLNFRAWEGRSFNLTLERRWNRCPWPPQN
jgi:hypothetical protein